jgi:hypothetical protein
MTDDFFITPHAIEQFRKRIARLSDEQAREVIRAGIGQATNVRKIWSAATCRRFGIRATCRAKSKAVTSYRTPQMGSCSLTVK